jgi:hypothetical protein
MSDGAPAMASLWSAAASSDTRRIPTDTTVAYGFGPMTVGRSALAPGMGLVLVGAALLHCTSSASSACFPDSDGITGGSYTIDLVVDDTGFYPSGGDDAGMRNVLTTQNDATVTLMLKNTGTKLHGFEVECTRVTPAFPNLPAGCPTMSCFPSNSIIAPIAPGTSTVITFFTPTPDGLLYPFKSSAPDDSTVPGLNGSQGSAWNLM